MDDLGWSSCTLILKKTSFFLGCVRPVDQAKEYRITDCYRLTFFDLTLRRKLGCLYVVNLIVKENILGCVFVNRLFK